MSQYHFHLVCPKAPESGPHAVAADASEPRQHGAIRDRERTPEAPSQPLLDSAEVETSEYHKAQESHGELQSLRDFFL